MRKVCVPEFRAFVRHTNLIFYRCNKPVNASKQITVHKAPEALCIQLKRFTPWGRKLTHPVAYPSNLSLQDVMSDGQVCLSGSEIQGVESHLYIRFRQNMHYMASLYMLGAPQTLVIIMPTSKIPSEGGLV
jgi:hypothetical protein